MFVNKKAIQFRLFITSVLILNVVIMLEAIPREEYTGKEAKLGQFPFAVRLYSKFKDSTVAFCTATVITDVKLLSAGHCCRANALRYVVLGDPDQTEFVLDSKSDRYVVHFVKKVIIHPNFERTEAKLVYDLCLLILEKPLIIKNEREVIQISYERLSSKKNCTALGWGTNFGHKAQHKLYYKDAIGFRCNLNFSNISKYWFVCLEPHSVCPGDSGGPLVCDNKLYGIASFFIGHGENSNPKCEEGVVDYYTELATEKEFIETNSFSNPLRSQLHFILMLVILNLSN